MPEAELPPGEMRGVKVGGLDLVIVRRPDGALSVLRDRCPHFGARLSLGRLQPLATGERTGERVLSETEYVVRCPWHNYEFDVESGRCPADPENKRVRTYAVDVEDGMIVVTR